MSLMKGYPVKKWSILMQDVLLYPIMEISEDINFSKNIELLLFLRLFIMLNKLRVN